VRNNQPPDPERPTCACVGRFLAAMSWHLFWSPVTRIAGLTCSSVKRLVRAALSRGLIYQLAASSAKVFARVAEGERIVMGRQRHQRGC